MQRDVMARFIATDANWCMRRPDFPAGKLYKVFLLPCICAAAIFLFTAETRAQCAARDVMRHDPKFSETPSQNKPLPLLESASSRVWRSIEIGTFANKTALYEALQYADCGIGDTAEQILVAPEFRLSSAAMKLDLIAVSVSELGLMHENTALKEIYSRALKLGLALPAAEVGPKLRLQYLDQPMGEFLEIGMAPITTRSGASSIFSVMNGGAGLLLLGEDVTDNSKFDPSVRFVFVRPRETAAADR